MNCVSQSQTAVSKSKTGSSLAAHILSASACLSQHLKGHSTDWTHNTFDIFNRKTGLQSGGVKFESGHLPSREGLTIAVMGLHYIYCKIQQTRG